MYFKDLTKKDKQHLRDMGITTLHQMKRNAAKQAEYRKSGELGSEPCWTCRAIAQKLGLPV